MKLAALVVLAACSVKRPTAPETSFLPPKPATTADRMVRLLPDGAQVVVELDLARLRANAVVGPIVTRALEVIAVQGDALPGKVPTAPLAVTDEIVLAAYGVGTSNAGTITLLATKTDLPGARRLAPDLVAIGQDAWLDQLEARVAIDARTPLPIPKELDDLRTHATPDGATGAFLRITARLGFDARVALARQVGIDVAPARLSVWADVADDFAMVVDADATDPGEKGSKSATAKLAATMRRTMLEIARTDMAGTLGVPNSFADAHQAQQGTWVRTIVAIGPQHLKRAMDRAGSLLPAASAGTVTP